MSSCPIALEPRPEISHVLFDFDGTLSLIRQGWPEVMVPMFVEALPRLPGETDEQAARLVLDDIMRLQRQADDLPDDPARRADPGTRGRASRAALVQARILAAIGDAHRRPNGRAEGARFAPISFWSTAPAPCSSTCASRGLQLYLASGTDESAVKQEAELLELTSHIRRPHLWRTRRLQAILQEDGHRPHLE